MPTSTSPQRKGALWGDTIAINGTTIKIKLVEHELSYSVNQREVTRVHVSTVASSDAVPIFVSSNQCVARIRGRGYAVGEPSEILSKLSVNTPIAVTISLGRYVLDGSLLLSDATHRVGRKRRFVGVSLAGVFSGSKLERQR